MTSSWDDPELAEKQTDRGWPWRANLRLLQSWWRSEVLDQPPGSSSARAVGPSGAWLPSAVVADPAKRHLNFYDAGVLELVDHRLRTRSWGGIVKEDRLLRSLLSSQPVCFNLFGVLARHPDVLLAWVQSLGIDAVAIEPTEDDDPALVRIEYAPPKSTHLGSGSAFDACITYRNSAGRRGVVAVETKYAENLADQDVTSDAKYAEATAALGHWKDSAVESLNRPVPVQCWQNLLLVQKAVQLRTHGWEHGTFVMTSDGRDLSALRATATLWSQLHDPQPWVCWSPYQSIIDIARAHSETHPWAAWFDTRYLDLTPIQSHLLDDPNRAPHPIRSEGDPSATDAFRSAAGLATTYAQRSLGTDSIVESLIEADLSAAPTLAILANASHLQDLIDPLAEARINTQPITAAVEGSRSDSEGGRAVAASEAAAFHEAGHAVVGVAFGLNLECIDIEQVDGRLGQAVFTVIGVQYAEPEEQDAWAAMTWAGTLAQEQAGFADGGLGFGQTDDGVGAHDESDLDELVNLAELLADVGHETEEYERWKSIASEALVTYWSAVEQIASALLERTHIDAAEVGVALAGSGPRAD